MTDFDDAAPSRTERKRAALDLQKTGGQLVALRAEDLARIPLGDDLREAIALYQRIRSHEAKRRQLQFIGKLLRGTEMDPVYAALDRINGQSNSVRYAFHQLEQWRERLIDDRIPQRSSSGGSAATPPSTGQNQERGRRRAKKKGIAGAVPNAQAIGADRVRLLVPKPETRRSLLK
jgi:hypothetical protein